MLFANPAELPGRHGQPASAFRPAGTAEILPPAFFGMRAFALRPERTRALEGADWYNRTWFLSRNLSLGGHRKWNWRFPAQAFPSRLPRPA